MNNNRSKYTEHYLIDFNFARELIRAHNHPLKSATLSASSAINRVISAPIKATDNLPNFNNSAMDGYAVIASDLSQASKAEPVILNLAGCIAAGEAIDTQQSTPQTAWKIMTGAAVPKGYDAIIPVEQTALAGDKVSCFEAPKLNAHIRFAGEDFEQGEIIAEQGTLVNSHLAMALAAQGITSVNVYQKPSIALFSTGKELVDNPQQTLKPGQIRNSNKRFLVDWLTRYPVELIDAGTNLDDPEKFTADLKRHLDQGTNIIISTGAVSMGDFDFIPNAILALGGKIIFHKVKIKPGKPILYAIFPNGSQYFGLPGNPISAAIGLRFFVSTALQALWSMPIENPIRGSLANQWIHKAGFAGILKSHARINQSAKLEVEILEGQESFKIKPLINANGWSFINSDRSNLDKGSNIDFYSASLFGLNQF